MARANKLQRAVAIDDAKEHGCVAAYFRVSAKKLVDVVEDFDGIAAEGHAGERALQHSSEQCCAKSLAADVGDQKCCPVFVDGKYIVVISSHLVAGVLNSGNGQIGIVVQSARQECLLDFARDAEFLLEALALAFTLNQSGVVEDAGGFDAECVENLAIDVGECGCTP